MSKFSAYFHLSKLNSKGYVVKNGNEYRLNLKFQSYGEHVKRTQPLYDVANLVGEDLAEELGDRVYCMAEQHGLMKTLCVS